jgi:hypothetical protein
MGGYHRYPVLDLFCCMLRRCDYIGMLVSTGWREKHYDRPRISRNLRYSRFPKKAYIGGFTVLSTKGVSSLLSMSLYLVFTFPISYLLLFVLATTAILQVKYLNNALARFSSTVHPRPSLYLQVSNFLSSK